MEVLSDRGTNFKSDLMKEVTRQLSVRQLHTSPYHPMANGMVEKFKRNPKTHAEAHACRGTQGLGSLPGSSALHLQRSAASKTDFLRSSCCMATTSVYPCPFLWKYGAMKVCTSRPRRRINTSSTFVTDLRKPVAWRTKNSRKKAPDTRGYTTERPGTDNSRLETRYWSFFRHTTTSSFSTGKDHSR